MDKTRAILAVVMMGVFWKPWPILAQRTSTGQKVAPKQESTKKAGVVRSRSVDDRIAKSLEIALLIFRRDCEQEYAALQKAPNGPAAERQVDRLATCLQIRFELIAHQAEPWYQSPNTSLSLAVLLTINAAADVDSLHLGNFSQDRLFVDDAQRKELTAWHARFLDRIRAFSEIKSAADLAAAMEKDAFDEFRSSCGELATGVMAGRPGQHTEMTVEALASCFGNLDERLYNYSLNLQKISKSEGVSPGLIEKLQQLLDEVRKWQEFLNKYGIDGHDIRQRELNAIISWEAARRETVKKLAPDSAPAEK